MLSAGRIPRELILGLVGEEGGVVGELPDPPHAVLDKVGDAAVLVLPTAPHLLLNSTSIIATDQSMECHTHERDKIDHNDLAHCGSNT